MSDQNKNIYVYENFLNETPSLMGILYSENKRGKFSYSFQFDDDFLDLHSENEGMLGSDIKLFSGRQFINAEGKLFGVFEDSTPDRWGRTLIKRKYKNQNLTEIDFLTKVSDISRMGGLRFKYDLDEDFINNEDSYIPPIKSLRELEDAATNVDFVASNDFSINLLSPGSSLGGARPKATVVDENGIYYIAKFPTKNDNYDIGGFEYVANVLMKKCGINVPDVMIKKFSKYGSTFLSKRFDRIYDSSNKIIKRCHMISAMTALGKTDGDSASYLDLVYFINQYSKKPHDDLEELFKRIAFNIAIKNVDDHLRNHLFIYENGGFTLSPCFDVNPTSYGKRLSLNIDNYDSTMSFDLLLSTARYFGLNDTSANVIINDILDIIHTNFEKECQQVDISIRSLV